MYAGNIIIRGDASGHLGVDAQGGHAARRHQRTQRARPDTDSGADDRHQRGVQNSPARQIDRLCACAGAQDSLLSTRQNAPVQPLGTDGVEGERPSGDFGADTRLHHRGYAARCTPQTEIKLGDAMMKYIDLLNRFWEANHADRFTTDERELYYYLLNECNHSYWRMPVSCSTSVVCAVIGMNRATLVRAREGLHRRGLIRFEEGVQPLLQLLAIPPTARATSYTTQKSNTNTSPDTDALLPIDELEHRLLADTEWHEQIVLQLAANGKSADADTLAGRLRKFFDYLRICKHEKKGRKEIVSPTKILLFYPIRFSFIVEFKIKFSNWWYSFSSISEYFQ